MWEVMFWPIVACVLLPWLLVYLGLHVVQRGIIFIDIAMAQMASLGICLAVLFHLDLQGWATFGIALGFTLVGGAIFSVTGKRSSQVPQEAVIGIAYVVAAATAVLLLSRAAEGDEQIKQMLVGNILLVTPLEVWKCFGFFTAVGILHFILRKNFLLVLVGFALGRRHRMHVWGALDHRLIAFIVPPEIGHVERQREPMLVIPSCADGEEWLKGLQELQS